jgi:type I restriction enzyme S subunit
MGLYCNPHSSYLNDVFSKLRVSTYCSGVLEDFIDINPSIDRAQLSDSSIVSFVPMPAVTEKTNQVIFEQRKYGDVKTGFTPFRRGDLLWAKITPCMQNGKSFLSDKMPTEYGFGSTEFHVLRPKSDKIYMPFLWVLLSDEHILEAAQGMFSGSAGQQRVPDTFLKKLPIVLPPFDIQKELANEVFVAMEQAKHSIETAEKEWEEAKAKFETELLREE